MDPGLKSEHQRPQSRPRMDDGSLWITIDSGAFEKVISKRMDLQFGLKPSNGSRGGVKYVTANRSQMNNKGEKDGKVRSKEEHTWVLKMPARDVQKSLMSLSRICDAGHHVVFLKDGGYTEHGRTGHGKEFEHEDNVHLLKVHCKKRFSRPWR